MGRKVDKQIDDFIAAVRNKFSVEKAILFGSRARGDNLAYSDYDVIIVSNDFEGVFFSKRISMMYEFWGQSPVDVEPLCYTSKEFDKKSAEIGIVREAVKEGIPL